MFKILLRCILMDSTVSSSVYVHHALLFLVRLSDVKTRIGIHILTEPESNCLPGGIPQGAHNEIYNVTHTRVQ